MRTILKRSLCILMSLLLSLSLINMINPTEDVYAYGMTAAATNDYTTWKQTSSSWGEATPWPNASIPKFGDAGCWITSVAILLRHYNVVTDSNVNTFNPLICNNRLMQYGIVNSAGDFCNLGNIKNAYPGFEYVGQQAYSLSNLKSLYDQGYACIVHETRGHYVAVRSVSSSAAVVMDPGYSTTSLTNSDTIQYFKATGKPNDSLSISNIQVSNVTSDSYTVSCKITGNATRALFPTWPSADDSGNPIWHEGTISGNTATCVIRRSDHGNKVGTYISHIYIYDASGNNVAAEAPAVQLVAFDSCLDYPTANASYTDTVYVAGWVVIPGGITNVTGWCNGISFDLPLFDRSDVPNGKGFNAFIPETYMKNGTNSLDIYGYHGTTPYHIKNINFTYKDIKRPTISDVKIINITEDSYTVTCKVSDNVKVTKVYFPTWPSIGSSADPVWHQGTINGDIASCVIKKSDHENKTGTYISHIYVYDDAGNEASYAAPAVELGKKHQHDYVSTIKKPATCTESGIRLYICKDNDDSYEEEIPATGHQHTELRNVKEATCAEAGYTGDTYCKDCNTKLNSGETIEKKAHTWDEGKITKNATCTEKGIKTFTCTVCESTRIEEIPATGHGNTITKFAKEASCKSEGYTGDVYCQDCGKLIEEGKILPKTEHTWNAGEITQAATCTGEGIKTFTCISCGTIRTEVIPATGHGITEIRNVKEATYTEEGYTGDTYCTVCGQKIGFGSTIAKLEQQKLTSGKIIKDKTTNGVYKVQGDGLSVEFTKPVSKKASVKIPDTIQVNEIVCKVTGIAANAFKNNTSLKTVTIGKNITVIGANAFYGCKNLSKIYGGSRIANIGYKAFFNCGNLSSITISGTVRSIGKQAFYNCKKLRTIVIKSTALSSRNVGTKAFTGTYTRPTVKVPAKQMNTYKKLLRSKGMSSKAIYKK